MRSTPPTTNTGMGDSQEFRSGGVESGQVLLPGIPDHLTIQNIAPKLTWETSNLMQMVSRTWQHACHSRSVYDARVLSQSTETFLVLRSNDEESGNAVLILYSCKNGTSLVLPPIPEADKGIPLECICLDGRVYLWRPADNFFSWRDSFLRCWAKLWALDLAGDRRWTERKWVEPSVTDQYHSGVLDAKIYRFRGSTRPAGVGVLETSDTDVRQPHEPPIRLKVEKLPQTQVYDPQANIWTIITPRPSLESAKMSKADLGCRLAAFCDWERELVRTASTPFIGPAFCDWERELVQIASTPFIGPYEPFYSEWRSWLSTKLASDNDYCRRAVMAPQVYHRIGFGTPFLFFIKEKLVRLVDHHQRPTGVDLEAFNNQKDKWEHWQSFTAPCHGGVTIWSSFIWNSAFADNTIWALVCLSNHAQEVVLVRSLPFLNGEANGKSAGWIETACSVSVISPRYSFVRPIYL